MKHIKLIQQLEHILSLTFEEKDREILNTYESQARRPYDFTKDVFNMALLYKRFSGITNVAKIENQIILAITKYREREFYANNKLDENNEIRWEIQKLIDSLNFARKSFSILSNVVTDEKNQIELNNIIKSIERFSRIMYDKKMDVNYIPYSEN